MSNNPNGARFSYEMGLIDFDAPCHCVELMQQNAELKKALEICAFWFSEWFNGMVPDNVIFDAKHHAKEALKNEQQTSKGNKA